MPPIITNQKVINSHPISESLIHWYSETKRDLPWRNTRNPYIIWVSEIILQQTRVDQGLPYFLRFVEELPTLEVLANAPEDQVLALWQGLGYYSRARNMQKTAKLIQTNWNGEFPSTYEACLRLPGIGPYTAAAISSICFDEPRPVVDGNVFRVTSRLYALDHDIALSGTRKIFEDVLTELIPSEQPGTFNQAMMELGATLCKPVNPICGECPIREYCKAYSQRSIEKYPVKSKKVKVVKRSLDYLVLSDGHRLLMKKRDQKDIWFGLYDFAEAHSIVPDLPFKKPTNRVGPITHILSHQKLEIHFKEFKLTAAQLDSLALSSDAQLFSLEQVLNLPKPKPVVDYIAKQFDLNFNHHK